MDNTIPIKNKINADNHIKAEPFRKDIRKTTPHKHKQYFEIIFLISGSGNHWIDGIQYTIKPNVLFFITQDQVHNWDLDTEPEGYVLILKSTFAEKSLDRELKMLLHRIHDASCLYMEEPTTIRQIFELLVRENTGSSEMAFHMKEGLVKALLAKILDSVNMEVRSLPVRTDLYSSFIALLHPEQPVKMKVAYFAGLLNTTPQNLNAACRKAVNQSAAGVMSDFIMNEAKRLLRYTNKTVSEISLSLNFSDPSHFVKFFRQRSGHTPQSYRLLQ